MNQQGLFYIAGHVALDAIFDSRQRNSLRNDLGGAVCYSSLAIKSLGYIPRIITRVGRDLSREHSDYIKSFADVDFDEYVDQGRNTTSYKIDTTGGRRKLWLLEKCSNLTLEDFSRATGNLTNDAILILNPVAGEISPGLLRQISGKFKYVFADSQGFVRRFDSETGLASNKILSDCSPLSGLFALKADRDELYSWTGIKNTREAIEEILSFADNLILTSGAETVELYCRDGRNFRAKPIEQEVKDTTGAGDILLATFAVRYFESRKLRESLEFATVASSLAIGTFGLAKAILSRDHIASNIEKVRER